jgi:Transposase domain (DUF772)
MIRILILGYVFAIRSERPLCREVQLNLAYRWFCGLGIEDKIPDHSAFTRAQRTVSCSGHRLEPPTPHEIDLSSTGYSFGERSVSSRWLRQASVPMRTAIARRAGGRRSRALFFKTSAPAEGTNQADFCNNIGPSAP